MGFTSSSDHKEEASTSTKPTHKLHRSNNAAGLSLFAALEYHRKKSRYIDNFPPLDDMGPQRRKLALLIRNAIFDGFMMVIIFMNLILVVVETDVRARGHDSDVYETLGTIFLFTYVAEIFCRIIVDQGIYFRKLLNVMDFSIVVADLCLLFVTIFDYPSISTLRVLRAVRLLRIARLMKGLRELWLMMHGMFAAMKAMSWAVVLILIALLLFSIVSVDILHPLTQNLRDDFPELCTRCDTAFSSVFEAFWSWFLLIFAQQLWIDMATTMVDAYPATQFFFLIVFFTINLGVLNLMLTVIVDLAEEARHQDERQTLSDKKNDYERARARLLKVCTAMDTDQSGYLTVEEVYDGYASNAEFEQTLQVMDVGPEDLQMVFEILDEDRSGSVTYEEFVEQLYKMKTQESHTLLVFMHHHLIGLKNKVTSLEDEMQSTVAALYSAGAVRTGSAAGSDVGGVVLPDERLKVDTTATADSQALESVGEVSAAASAICSGSLTASRGSGRERYASSQPPPKTASTHSAEGQSPLPGLHGLRRLKERVAHSLEGSPKERDFRPGSMQRGLSPVPRLDGTGTSSGQDSPRVFFPKKERRRSTESVTFAADAEHIEDLDAGLAGSSKELLRDLSRIAARLERQHRTILQKLDTNISQLTTVNEI
mmetsp:Transcript_60204/g.135494  ORF Transcript_60204/g.135494 Transcript_60204/m.135494 type:complete len:654 (-) Transcript_60204:69-2030(-)